MVGVTTQVFNESQHPRGAGGRFVEKSAGDPGQLDLDAGQMDDRELLAHTRRMAFDEARKWDGAVDVDDLQSDVVVALLEGRQRGERDHEGAAVAAGAVRVSGWVDERAAARRLASNIAARAVTGHGSGPDYAGYRKFRERLVEFVGREQRMPSSDERSVMADEVRLSFPPGRRPRKGYERWRAGVSRDVRLGGVQSDAGFGDSALVVTDEWTDLEPDGFEDGSFGSEALVAADVGGRSGTTQARRLAFVSLAEVRGVRLPVEGCVSAGSARRLRRLIADEGGAGVLVERVRGGVVTPASERFVGLFGPMSQVERVELAGVLASHPAYTEDLVASAIAFATRR